MANGGGLGSQQLRQKVVFLVKAWGTGAFPGAPRSCSGRRPGELSSATAARRGHLTSSHHQVAASTRVDRVRTARRPSGAN